MWQNSQFTADLVTFTEEILNVKLHFLWSDIIFSELFNPFLVNVTILHSLKKPEMKKFSAIFKGVKLEH